MSGIDKLKRLFQELYAEEPLIVRSPGRVNIIGEHTDYNEGFVLPAAIDKSIYVAVSKREDGLIKLYAASFDLHFEVSLHDIQPTGNWASYILGVAFQLQQKGHIIGGFNLVVDGDVPAGAGLSSSAAVECAVVYALNELFGLDIDKMEMVLIAQKAEHSFSGVMCGVMDMFASMFGKKDQAIKLDCRSLAYEYKPIQLQGFHLVLFNTNIKHSLSSSEYNLRREQCEQGVAWTRQRYPSVNSLRDINTEMLAECVAGRDALVFKRCNFIIGETKRLLAACDDLEAGNIHALGKKMFETHTGLSRDYEVSCRELDFLVNAVQDNPSVPGARMMGGGFGGCTLNIVKEEAIEQLIDQVADAYKKSLRLNLTSYIVQTGNGTELITAKIYREKNLVFTTTNKK